MSPDPYKDKILTGLPIHDKTPVVGKLNCILDARANNRSLELVPFPSRALLKGEIHELILTDEAGAAPGKTVNNIAYLAFFEVLEGGILWAGDQMEVDGKVIGRLAGYDMTHFPNHMNIVIRVEGPLNTGAEMDMPLGAPLAFRFMKGK